jgi:mannose-6-phosphate isomerase-like protein (cupin superfamily)
MTILNRDEAQPFTTADGSTIREFLNAGNSGLKNQSLAEATLAPGQATTTHFHPLAEEIYFITRGSGVMLIGDETRSVGVGDAIAIPSGQTHKIWNEGNEDLVFLCCCAPAYSHEDTVLVEESPAPAPDAL